MSKGKLFLITVAASILLLGLGLADIALVPEAILPTIRPAVGNASCSEETPSGCTVFTVAKGGRVFFGGNDDYIYPDSYYWVDPGIRGYGAIWIGRSDNVQQGVNEKGLAYDANGLPRVDVNPHRERTPVSGDYTSYPIHILRECATVEEVIAWVDTHQWHYYMHDQMQFADATGDAVIISAVGAADDETFYRLLNQMLWKLNSSHTGVLPAGMWTSIEPVVFAEGEIGIDVRLLDERAVITRVEAGSPAETAGLRPGFVIQEIDGVLVEEILADQEAHLTPPYNAPGRIDGLTRSLLGLIYGDPDQCVTLAYLDQDDARHEQCIDRVPRPWLAPMAGVALPPAFLEFESGRLENDIGYIRFNTFHPELVSNMEEAVAALQDAPGIIIDLRGNPGGALEAGEPLAGLFLEERALFGRFKTRDETIDMVVDAEGVYDGPVVILIDALSYSCSEWFTFGMQSSGRAVIVGERSPGGITAMGVKTLPNGASLAYPVATLLALDGMMLEGYGIIPDITVALERSQLLDGVDAQWEAGIDYILNWEIIP